MAGFAMLLRNIRGLVAGATAKWIMPGNGPGGIMVTIMPGIAGACTGGFIGTLLGLGTVSGLNPRILVIQDNLAHTAKMSTVQQKTIQINQGSQSEYHLLCVFV